MNARVERWKASRFDPVRKYVRLLHSLVLFAEHELTPAAAHVKKRRSAALFFRRP